MEPAMNRPLVFGLALISAAIASPAIVLAQAPPKVMAQAGHRDPEACHEAPATIGRGQGSDIDVKTPGDRTLSDQLAQSSGVICPPPHVDSEIHHPAPPGGTMPVIPPPGSPGGNPDVKPK
jgi:hypothetical protein